jgi:hypothetical protein
MLRSRLERVRQLNLALQRIDPLGGLAAGEVGLE